jgi:predicted nuclease with TOPRIM domain
VSFLTVCSVNFDSNFQTLTQDYEDIKLSADKLTHEKEDLELSINTKCSDNEESMNILNDLTKQNQELELKVKELTLEKLKYLAPEMNYLPLIFQIHSVEMSIQ